MASSNESISNPNECATLTWTIAEFAQVDRVISSPVFSSPNSRNRFQFKLTNTIHKNNIHTLFELIYLGPKEEARFYYLYSILDANGERKHTRERFWEYNKSHRQYDPIIYLSRDKFEKYLVNGSLTIYCEVEFDNSSPSQFKSFGKLSENYESLLKSGKFSDFIVQIGDKQLRVHKTVLATRSPVFAAMFEHEDTREVKEGRVVIEDVEVDVFELLIRYIYTGKVNQLGQHAAELFVAADKYQLDDLKSACEQSLISTLTTESVCGVLLLSDMHNAQQLKCECIEYLVEHAKEVMQTKEWKELANSKRSDLIAELFEKLANPNKGQ